MGCTPGGGIAKAVRYAAEKGCCGGLPLQGILLLVRTWEDQREKENEEVTGKGGSFLVLIVPL